MLNKNQIALVQEALVELGLVVEGHLPEGEWDSLTNQLYWQYAANTPPHAAQAAIGQIPGEAFQLHPGIIEAAGGEELFYEEVEVAEEDDGEYSDDTSTPPAQEGTDQSTPNALAPSPATTGEINDPVAAALASGTEAPVVTDADAADEITADAPAADTVQDDVTADKADASDEVVEEKKEEVKAPEVIEAPKVVEEKTTSGKKKKG